MAHDLETTNDGTTSFAYSGKIGSAWHRLGIEMDGLSTTQEILAACRGDYEVYKDPLLAVDPLDYMQAIPTGRSFTWRERYTYTEDGTPDEIERQVLGIVGNDYRVIQHSAAVNLGLELANLAPDQPNIDCAGVLDDGRRFFCTIPLPELVIDPEGINDRYGRNMVVVTGHDGTQSLEIVNGFTRAVCANTVAAALRGSSQRIKIRHVGNDDLPVAVAKKQLGMVLSADEEFLALAHTMLDIDCDWAMVEKVANKLWPLKEDANERQQHNHDKRLAELNGIWQSDRAAGGSGENRYAAFQTFTEWMEYDQHIVGKDTSYNRAYRAVESPGFNKRVHTLSNLLTMSNPLKSDKWTSVSA